MSNDPISSIDPLGLLAYVCGVPGNNPCDFFGPGGGAGGGGVHLSMLMLSPEEGGGGGGAPKKPCTLSISVPSNIAQASKDEAQKIYNNAGINLKFVNSGKSADYVVQDTILPRGVLGVAPPESPNLALVDTQQIFGMGVGNGMVPTAIGRIFSHELGHQILNEAHSATGLMMTGIDHGNTAYYGDLGGWYLFTDAQKQKIQKKCNELHKK